MSENSDGISKEEEREVDRLVSSQAPSQEDLHGAEELYNCLGSWELLSAVVSLLHTKLIAHPDTRVFFVNKDKTEMGHILRHMATFLSCALTGHLTLSPKELWDIHKHMLWHPDGSADAPRTGTSASCPVSHSRPGNLSTTATASCPVSHSGPGRTSPSSISAAVSSSDKHVGGKHAHDGGKRPVLGPWHVDVMTGMLVDALMELDAKQELIDDMVKVVSGTSYLFERGDVFLDSRGEQAKWQHERSMKAKQDRVPQSIAVPIRASKQSADKIAQHAKKGDGQHTAPARGGLSGQDFGRAETIAAQQSVEDMRNLFASW